MFTTSVCVFGVFFLGKWINDTLWGGDCGAGDGSVLGCVLVGVGVFRVTGVLIRRDEVQNEGVGKHVQGPGGEV